jgi:AP2-associated kinase
MRGAANDPFAALDSKSLPSAAVTSDELSARFPSLDEFSILHDRGTKFEFSQTTPTDKKQEELNKRVTQALADEAFAQPMSKPEVPPKSAPVTRTTSLKIPAQKEPQRDLARHSQPALIHQPTPTRPAMVSTGIQTSPPPSPKPRVSSKYPEVAQRPIWRVPGDSSRHHQRTLSQPRAAEDPRRSAPTLHPEHTLPPRPSMIELSRNKSQTNTLQIPKSPASSRPSLEGSRPSALDISDSLSRSRSANSRPRPSSVHVESNLDYLRHRELGQRGLHDANESESESDSAPEQLEKNISSNVDFLRAMEGDEPSKRKGHRRTSSGTKSKRTSLPSISLSGTKNILAGKFGEAFRRFETNSSAPEPRTPSPMYDRERSGTTLTPIAGSEATGSLRDDQSAIDETEDIPPEMKRELERRRLSQEEKRVADAAAEYRKRLAQQGGKPASGPSKASSIQNRVKTLLEDSSKQSPTRTAEGYGRFTEPPAKSGPSSIPATVSAVVTTDLPPSQDINRIPSKISRKPIGATSNTARPSAPPKPVALRTGGSGKLESPVLGSPLKPSSLAGKPLKPTQQQFPHGISDVRTANGEDWEADFSKRYPSLSGLEMVETEIGKGVVRDI